MHKNAKRDERCTYTTADGRRCRALRLPAGAGLPGRGSLCLRHWQQCQQQARAAAAGKVLSKSSEFNTATGIHQALGKVFSLLARNSIPARDAAVLAYIGQLMLNSLGAVEREFRIARGTDQFEEFLRQALHEARRERELADAGREEPAEDDDVHGDVHRDDHKDVHIVYVPPGEKSASGTTGEGALDTPQGRC